MFRLSRVSSLQYHLSAFLKGFGLEMDVLRVAYLGLLRAGAHHTSRYIRWLNLFRNNLFRTVRPRDICSATR